MQSNALDKKVRIAPKTFLFFAFFHFLFYDIGSLIECYQNDLQVAFKSIL